MDLQLPQVRRDKLAERVPVTRPGAPTTTAGLSDRSLIIVLVLRVHRFTGCR